MRRRAGIRVAVAVAGLASLSVFKAPASAEMPAAGAAQPIVAGGEQAPPLAETGRRALGGAPVEVPSTLVDGGSSSEPGEAGSEGTLARVERRVALMGTHLDLAVEASDRAAALAASEVAVTAVEAAEARLSTWTTDSELARLNAAPPDTPVELSPELAAELAAALTCAELTAGAFDPTLGALAGAWGLRQGGREPGAEELSAARAASGAALLELAEGRAVRRHPGVAVDEGGFGKGAGIAVALAALAADGRAERAVLDFGGQVALWERRPGGRPGVVVGVADPQRRPLAAAVLSIDGGSVATSGNGERGIVAGGVRRGHLLDPRAGEPAPDWGSLTVWVAAWAPVPGGAALGPAGHALFADCLSTGLYVLGPEKAIEWASRRPGVEVLVLAPDGRGGVVGLATAGLAGRVEPVGHRVRVDVETRGKTGNETLRAATGLPETKTRAAVATLVGSGPSALPNPSPVGSPAGAGSEEEYR